MNGSAGDPSGSSEPKPWERSWSTDEMRQNAHAWNLAGDTGLLKYLQEFSQTVLTHTHATEKSLDTLAEAISTLTSDVNTTNNKFLCLANTQFVENRVYDDDDKETPQDEPVPKTQSKEETDAKMLQKVREALSLSVAVLDTMFEPVEIQASDSEGEAEIEQQTTKTLLLEPHNPYIHRPLPHLIGSEAFMSDDHIGLADSPSDEEEESLKTGVEYDMDASSDSDIDFTPSVSNKRKMDMNSSGSSVSTGHEKMSRSAEPVGPMQSAGNANEDITEQQPSSTGQTSFASQLAAKLDKIASPATSSNFAAEKTTSDNLFGGVLSDNEDDALFSKNTGLFSNRPGLFDDLEDTNSSLWGPDEGTVKDETPEVKKVEQSSKPSSKSDASNLFSSNGSDDEDNLFFIPKAGKTVAEESHKKISEPIGNVKDDLPKTSSPLSASVQSNTQPPLVQKESTDKKLAGAVPMFGKANVLEGLKTKLPRRQSSSSSESSGDDPAENNVIPPKEQTCGESSSYDQRQTPTQGFSSTVVNSTISSDIESNKPSEVSASIFNVPSTSNDDEDDIFAKKPSTFSPPYSEPVSGGLFADVDDEEDDLFAVSPAPKQEQKKETPDRLENQVNPSILKQEENSKIFNQNAGNGQQISTKPAQSIIAPKPTVVKSFMSTVPPPLKSESKTKKPVSLFDDSDSGEDDLFSSASSAGSRRSQASTDRLSAVAPPSVEKKSLSKKGLFDDDDALFGSTPNDPDIDIFGLSKSTTGSKTLLGETKPAPQTNLFKEDSSIPDYSSSEIPTSSVLGSGGAGSSISAEVSKPDLKPVPQDVFLAGDSTEKTSSVISKPSMPSSNLSNSIGNDNLKKEIPQGITVASSVDSTKPKPFKPSLAVGIEEKSEKQKMPTDEKQIASKATNKGISSSINVEPSPQINAQTQPRKPEPPRTLNIRKETDPGLGLFDDSNEEDDDLFSISSKKETQRPPLKENVKPPTAAKPASSANPKTSGLVDLPVQKPDTPQTTVESSVKNVDVADGSAVSVSKLRNSLLVGGNGQPVLKIDPRALLPGQKPPPRRTPPKEDKPLPEATPKIVPETKEPQPTENKVGFDQPTLSNATLSSINKDRAKLGVKRRPPSNRARREAARASQNLDQSDKDSPLSPDASSIWTDSISVVNSNGNSNNSVLSPSTDEDDLFGVPQDLPVEYDTAGDVFSSPPTPILSPVAPANHDIKPEKGKVTDQIKEFQDSLQKNASLFLPPDIDDDSLSEKLFDAVVDTTSVADTDTEVDTAPVTYTSHMVDSVPEIDSVPGIDSASKMDSVPVVDTTPAVSIAPVVSTTSVESTTSVDSTATVSSTALTNAKSVMAEDPTSLKTAVDSPQVATKHSLTPPDGSPKTFLRKDDGTVPALDPLNKQERTSVDNDSDLFGNNEAADEPVDDHSALFPFVKKKLDSKQSSNQPLFSQTPELPSKTDKSAPKTDLGGLDEVEDNNLFSSASLKSQISTKKAPALQNKEVKTWIFSDEDDDDLFQTSAKKVQSKPSQDVPSQANKSKTVSPEPRRLEKNAKSVKPSQSKASNGLFSDENDDDDLFSKPSPMVKSKVKDLSKPSLFEDDDDDLFGSKQPKSFKSPNPSKPEFVPGTSVQTQASSKVKKENVFDDPLKAFQDD